MVIKRNLLKNENYNTCLKIAEHSSLLRYNWVFIALNFLNAALVFIKD